MRAVLRPVQAVLLSPALLGALYLLALAARAGTRETHEERALGAQATAITSFVQSRFGGEVTRVTIAIAAAAFAIGATLGLLAGGLVAARDALSGREARDRASHAGVALAVTIAAHALFEAWGMASAPQLYADSFYAGGGLLRTLQIVVTDVMGRGGIVVLGGAALVAFLAGPRRAWPRWGDRARALRARLTRRAVPASVGAALLLALGGAALALGARHGGAPVALALAQAAAAGSSSAAATTVAQASASAGTSQSRRPNVLLLAADSLRADRIEPRVAPHLAALAARGTRFERAYVSIPRTFPSWVTILTGRHAHHHGIRSMFPRWEERTKDFDALPARLARAGYATGVVSDYAGDIFSRIDLGFSEVDTPTFDFRQLIRQRGLERQTPLLPFLHSRAGRAVFPVLREMNDAADPSMLASDAIAALGRLGKNGRPFFLTVFFSTAHFPYAAPAPYYARFTDPAYRGRFKYHKPVGLGREQQPDARDVAQVRGLYDGAVASIDDAAQEILDALGRAGLAETTIVVVTADHGETLYENGHGQGHGDHLFGDEGTHVPLLVIDPRRGAGPRREARIARDVDIAATLYELTGVAPPGDLDGRSLAPALDGKPLAPVVAPAETELWFTEEIPGLDAALRIPYPGIAHLTEVDAAHGDEVVLQSAVEPLTRVARHRMVRDERWKLLYVPARSGAKYILFDTLADPGETRDVASTNPAVLEKLKGDLWSFMLRDAEMIERGGYLVPRGRRAAAESAAGLRIDDEVTP